MTVESSEDRVSLLVDFGVMASWVPSSGAPAVSAPVLFDEPDVLENYGAARRRFRVTFQTEEFAGLDKGETIDVAGTAYVVAEVQRLGDGKFSHAVVTREDFRP